MALHYFVITSFNSFNQESLASSEVSLDFALNPHGIPGGFLISWGAVAGATKYRLYHGTSTGVYTAYLETTNTAEYWLVVDSLYWSTTVGTPGSPPNSLPSGALTWSTQIGKTGINAPTDSRNAFLIGDHLWLNKKNKIIFSNGGNSITTSMATLSLSGSSIKVSGENGTAAIGLLATGALYATLQSSGNSLAIGSTYKNNSVSSDNAIIQGSLSLGAISPSASRKLHVAGEMYSTGLTVGSAFVSINAPSNGILADNALIGTSVNSIAWGLGTPELGINGPMALSNTQGSGGIYLYQSAADTAHGVSQIRSEVFSSPTRRTLSNYLRTPENSDSYWLFGVEAPIDSGTPRTVARIVRGQTESSSRGYVQVVTDRADCFRWTTNTSFATPTGTTETFIINAHSGTHINLAAVAFDNGGLRLTTTAAATTGRLIIPLKLPQGGIITNLQMVYDNHSILAGPGNMRLFRRLNTSTGPGTQVGTTTNWAAPGPLLNQTTVMTGLTNHTVLEGYTYYLECQLTSNGVTASDMTFYQLKVEVTLDRHYPSWMG